jgi:hypothetical protein
MKTLSLDATTRRIQTRKLYRFEEERLGGKPVLKMKTLRKLGRRVWKKHGGRRKLPPIVAGRGDLYNGRLYSYYDGEKIVLARNERRKFVLIHELTHALGCDDHDRKFIQRYCRLLRLHDPSIQRKTLQDLRMMGE